MSAMKKGTKLVDNRKDYMLRARMDEETVEKLNFLSDFYGISRSEVVRKGIEEQYSAIKK